MTIEQILDLYGYRTKRGFMCCPFHGEKEPSLKVYGGTKGWHCFGCERGGSVLDFVMEHENCKLPAAVRAIDTALHLGLMDAHEDPTSAHDRKRVQEALDRFVEQVYQLCDAKIYGIELQQQMNLHYVKKIEEKPVEERNAKEWDVIHQWAEEDEYDEYRKEKILEFKEEVAEWRRKARRTG